MKKVLVRHEPVLFYLYLFGIGTLFSLSIVFERNHKEPIEIFVILLLIELALLCIHITLRDEVIAEINPEGIKINEKRFIQWNEIRKWNYEPSGKLSRNRLKFELINGEDYEIRGFSYLKVTRILKRYIPAKQSWFSRIWDLFVRGVLIYVIVKLLTIIKSTI